MNDLSPTKGPGRPPSSDYTAKIFGPPARLTDDTHARPPGEFADAESCLRAADARPSTWDADELTFDAVVLTATPVQRSLRLGQGGRTLSTREPGERTEKGPAERQTPRRTYARPALARASRFHVGPCRSRWVIRTIFLPRWITRQLYSDGSLILVAKQRPRFQEHLRCSKPT